MSALVALGRRIEEEHEAARRDARSALEHALACGRLLIEAKAAIGHGEWLGWLREHTTVAPRQSQRYMRLAQHAEELEGKAKCDTGTHLTMRGVLAALATPRVLIPRPEAFERWDWEELEEWAEGQLKAPFCAWDLDLDRGRDLGWLTTKLLHQLRVPDATSLLLGFASQYEFPAVLRLAAAEEKPKPSTQQGSGTAPGSLDFDLLGAPPPQPHVDEGALRLRRGMLTAHQAVGFGLFSLQLATTIVGQLNYSDRFAGGPSTAKYQQTHAILAYATLATFAADGLLALLAPAPLKRSEGFDRVTLHKVAMFTAAAGMAAQGVLGIVTREREGYLNQPDLAAAHLVIGYVTLAAVTVGVGAIVF